MVLKPLGSNPLQGWMGPVREGTEVVLHNDLTVLSKSDSDGSTEFL